MLNALRALIVLITLTIKQAFFPQITSPHGCPVKIQDTEGKEWGFHFCYWLNNGSKMYVLEGLKDYIGSMQWQAGDIGKLRITCGKELEWTFVYVVWDTRRVALQ